jgi:threonine/homoserine/homoserine lactone efflux protein
LFELIVKAVITGFILSLMIGPVFFLLLETSIRKGIRAALAFDLGVIFSDCIYISIAFFFYSEVAGLMEGESESYMKMFGGIMLLIFGVVTFMKTPKEEKVKDLGQNNTFKDYFMLFVKGLILNTANPMVIFYWFSVMALGAKQNTDMSFTTQMLIYIGIILAVFFSIDILKIIGAKKLRPFITNKVLRSLNHFTGSILMIFGVILFIQGLMDKL